MTYNQLEYRISQDEIVNQHRQRLFGLIRRLDELIAKSQEERAMIINELENYDRHVEEVRLERDKIKQKSRQRD